MTIYSVFIIIILLLFLIEYRGVPQKRERALFFLSSFLVFFLMAFRGDDIGGDTIEYVHFWEGYNDTYGTWKSPPSDWEYEPGLAWLCSFFHLFNDGSHWFFIFFESLFVLAPFHYLVWRDSKYKVLPNLLFMIMWSLLDITFTGLRQVLGISFLMIAYIIWTSSWKNKKLKSFLSFSSVAFGLCFHAITYFMAILYGIAYLIKKTNKKWIFIVLGFSYFMAFANTLLMSSLYTMIGDYFASSEALFRLYHYFYEDLTKSTGLYQLIATFFVGLIVLLSDDNNSHNRFYVNCLVFGCVIFNVFSFFPNAPRIVEPLFFVGIIASPSQINNKSYRKYKLIFLSIVMLFSIQRIINWEKDSSDKSSPSYEQNQMLPYKFIWE